MKKQKLKIEIEVWGIEVEETQHYENGNGSGWYQFQYSVKKNGGKKKLGQIDGSWSSQTKSQFKRALNTGYASRCVLEQLY